MRRTMALWEVLLRDFGAANDRLGSTPAVARASVLSQLHLIEQTSVGPAGRSLRARCSSFPRAAYSRGEYGPRSANTRSHRRWGSSSPPSASATILVAT